MTNQNSAKKGNNFFKGREIIIFALVIIALGFGAFKLFFPKKAAVQYQTSTAEKGTLISSVSSSGSISSGNNLSISTAATGVIDKVFVKNGDKVRQGQTIATILPDQDSKQKQIAAWGAVVSAQNQLSSAQTAMYQLQSTAAKADQVFHDQAQSQNLSPDDITYITQKANKDQADAQLANQPSVINAAQISLTNAQLSYQKLSNSIIAPSAGTVSNLIIAPGTIISQQSSSNSNSSGTQQIGTITRQQNNLQAAVNLSEMDVTKVKVGQKVTISLDAFPNKTFTGKVLLVNTNGQVSSGVTNYPTIIGFDTDPGNIYPNMGVSTDIITNIKNDVVLVPSTAVKTSNGQSMVQVMKNGQVSSVPVEIGDSNDTQTEITSGINEGDVVVTNTSNSSAAKASTSTSSVFSNIGRGGGGNAVRIQGGFGR